VHLQNSHLSEYCPRNCLSKLDQKFRNDSGFLVFLRLECHLGNFTKDFVSKLDVVKFLRKDIQELGHRFCEMLVILKGLDDSSLRSKDVSMVLYRKAEGLVNTHPDRL
jgi:hypothetical protein